jgi:fumarylacetoacetase
MSLPFGVFSAGRGVPRVGVRQGAVVLDLAGVSPLFRQPSLNAFLAAGPVEWADFQARLPALLGSLPAVPLAEAVLHLPFEVADYTDFYSSEEHATNVGRILRPGEPPLPPNWKHEPIGYHGRSATVVVSGTPIARPSGQLGAGVFGPSQRLDIEAEVGFVVGVPGSRLRTTDFAAHVFGVVLVNDWSARDIQAWEYRPLGPFLAKSFATSISPWVMPLSAFVPVPAVAQAPVPLDYLRPAGDGLDIRLAVDWNDTRVSTPPFAGMYWTPAQQLAHLTSNGARVRTGDLFASGTVSGPSRTREAGSFIELTWNGTQPVKLADGSTRGFLLDGDTVTISGSATSAGGEVLELGPVTGVITR